MFGAQIATRSPGPTPLATSARATSAARAASPAYVNRTGPSTSASSSGHCRAARASAAGMVAGVVAGLVGVVSAFGAGSVMLVHPSGSAADRRTLNLYVIRYPSRSSAYRCMPERLLGRPLGHTAHLRH